MFGFSAMSGKENNHTGWRGSHKIYFPIHLFSCLPALGNIIALIYVCCKFPSHNQSMEDTDL